MPLLVRKKLVPAVCACAGRAASRETAASASSAMLAEFFIASSRLILGAPLLTRRMDHYSGLRRHDRAPQI